jgi:hypothetical protein
MHKAPLIATSISFVESAPVRSVETGIKAVVEVTAYPGRHFRIDLSMIGGSQNDRPIKEELGARLSSFAVRPSARRWSIMAAIEPVFRVTAALVTRLRGERCGWITSTNPFFPSVV